MKIYTKTGQRRNEFVWRNQVSKNHPRIDAYGDVDELNAFVGLLGAYNSASTIDALLKDIQETLFDVGAIWPPPQKANAY